MGRIKLSERTVPEFGYCLFCVASQKTRQVRLYESQHEGQRIVKTICDACLGEIAAIAQQLGVAPSPEWSREWPTEPGRFWACGRSRQELSWGNLIFVWVFKEHDQLVYRTHYGSNLAPRGRDLVWAPANLPDPAGALVLLEEDADDDLC